MAAMAKGMLLLELDTDVVTTASRINKQTAVKKKNI
jgi:hypothetical protein